MSARRARYERAELLRTCRDRVSLQLRALGEQLAIRIFALVLPHEIERLLWICGEALACLE